MRKCVFFIFRCCSLLWWRFSSCCWLAMIRGWNQVYVSLNVRKSVSWPQVNVCDNYTKVVPLSATRVTQITYSHVARKPDAALVHLWFCSYGDYGHSSSDISAWCRKNSVWTHHWATHSSDSLWFSGRVRLHQLNSAFSDHYFLLFPDVFCVCFCRCRSWVVLHTQSVHLRIADTYPIINLRWYRMLFTVWLNYY